MSDPNSPSSEGRVRTLWIVFGGLCASHFLYWQVGVVAVKPVENASTAMNTPLLIAALIVTGVVLGSGRIFGKVPYLPFCIIRWALAEAIAIFGLVIAITTGDSDPLLAGILWSLLLNLWSAPTRRDHERFVQRGGAPWYD